jgi:hypothetical protein
MEVAMPTIEIDFQVFKELTMLRATEVVTYNDVLRSLLELPPAPESSSGSVVGANTPTADALAWVSKGVSFPSGTVFKANYKGAAYTAKVQGGKLLLNGKAYDSLSAAGIAVTKGNVNGWRFWQCKRPCDSAWVVAEAFRA